MLYAISEIVLFLLLAAVVGGAAGWWLGRTGKISVLAAMNRSGAHAAAGRELDAARAEIERLTSKLAIATEAIRELETERVRATGSETVEIEEPASRTYGLNTAETLPEVPAAPVVVGSMTDGAEAVAETSAPDAEPETAATGSEATGATGEDMDADEFIVETVRAKGGKRLSERVAEASVFSRADRGAPKIEFTGTDDE